MGMPSCQQCVIPVSRTGVQEVHVVGAGCAGLSAAVQLAEKLESAFCAGRIVIYVWDGTLQRFGLRRRRVTFRATADDNSAPQDVAVQRQVLSATLSSETQAALFPEEQQQCWEHTYSASRSELQQALLSRAQSPELRQHICFKPYHLSHDMLRTIAAKPDVIIIGADGGNSTVRNALALGEHSYTEEDSCIIEVAYQMTGELASRMQESVATSLVHTVGQRVFLHNFDCKGGHGSITIRVTQEELDELPHYNGVGVASSKPNNSTGSKLIKQPSLSAVALSDLIDSALHIYGVPASAVKHITGHQHVLRHASFFGRKLSADVEDVSTVLLVGDAAMQVEFWPGRGISTAFVSAHVATSALLSSMTNDSAQPCFAVKPAHLREFSRLMTRTAEMAGKFPSMDVLSVPPPNASWAAVATMPPEAVVHALMEQICNRGATAADHLWPVLPSHALIESKLRQMLPDKVHVLRRMLRDGPWPGEAAIVMKPLNLPPFLSRQSIHSGPSPVQNAASLSAPVSSKATGAGTSQRYVNEQQTSSSSVHQASSQASSPSQKPEAAHSCQNSNSSLSNATNSTSSRHSSSHVSCDTASSKGKSSKGTLAHSDSATSSTSCQTTDSSIQSDIDAKIAVLSKWGQPLPQLLAQAAEQSSLPKAPAASKMAPRRLVIKKKKKKKTGSLSRKHSTRLTQVLPEPASPQTSLQPETSTAAQTLNLKLPAKEPSSRSLAQQTQQALLDRQSQSQAQLASAQMPSLTTPPQTPSPSAETHRSQPHRALLASKPQELSLASEAHKALLASEPQRGLLVSEPQRSPESSEAQRALLASDQRRILPDPPSVQQQQLRREAAAAPQLHQHAQLTPDTEQQNVAQPSLAQPRELQMWPHVRNFSVPLQSVAPVTHASLKVAFDSSSTVPQQPLASTQTHRQRPTERPPQAEALRKVHSQRMTQPASLSQSRELRQVQSQGASREPLADLNFGQQAQPELSIKAGKAYEQRTPDWIGNSAALQTATGQQKQLLWQTPHASDKWCVQGNALFGWWELGSALVGDLPDLQTAKQNPLA